MPRQDGTGPAGAGAKTGWGRGPCGRGMRRGQGRGFGAVELSKTDKKKILEAELKEVQKELDELKKQKD